MAYLVHLLLKDGYAYNDAGVIMIEPLKYLHNLLDMPYVLCFLLFGIVSVLWGIGIGIWRKDEQEKAIWYAGAGTVVTVLCLMLCAGWNHTAYYPSTADLQSSLTIHNSCSSEFTLRTMFWVSFIIPFVLAYIVYAWRAIDRKKLDRDEIRSGHAY